MKQTIKIIVYTNINILPTGQVMVILVVNILELSQMYASTAELSPLSGSSSQVIAGIMIF